MTAFPTHTNHWVKCTNCNAEQHGLPRNLGIHGVCLGSQMYTDEAGKGGAALLVQEIADLILKRFTEAQDGYALAPYQAAMAIVAQYRLEKR